MIILNLILKFISKQRIH